MGLPSFLTIDPISLDLPRTEVNIFINRVRVIFVFLKVVIHHLANLSGQTASSLGPS